MNSLRAYQANIKPTGSMLAVLTTASSICHCPVLVLIMLHADIKSEKMNAAGSDNWALPHPCVFRMWLLWPRRQTSRISTT